MSEKKGVPGGEDLNRLHWEIQALRAKIRRDINRLGQAVDNNVIELATHPLWLQRNGK